MLFTPPLNHRSRQARQRVLAVALLCVVATGAYSHAGHATDGVRTITKLDANWLFHRGDATGAEALDFDDRSWPAVDLPHDWSIEDYSYANQIDLDRIRVIDMARGMWRYRGGDQPEWKESEFEDSSWEKVTQPAKREELSPVGWYRRRVQIEITNENGLQNQKILLSAGKILGADETYFNGTLIGATGKMPPNVYHDVRNVSRLYPIPTDLLNKSGENLVAIRVYEPAGKGSIRDMATVLPTASPFDPESSRAMGYMNGGVGWYRKRLEIPDTIGSRRYRIDFDGVYRNADVWINGHHLGFHPYGYTGFGYDITPHLRPGEENILAVRVNNTGKHTRWYSGSGITRQAWLTETPAVHFAKWATAVSTASATEASASVRTQTTIRNETDTAQNIELQVTLLDPHGNSVAHAGATKAIPSNSQIEFDELLSIERPELWSPASPAMYSVACEIHAGEHLVDRIVIPTGIRHLAFSAEKGFLLNGEPWLLKGACMHHDNGCLGAAAYARAEERRVRLMKENGFNAIRCSHNPPSSAFLDACDRLGMFVIDEAFDTWAEGANLDDYHVHFENWWREDLKSMVLRDRNHPSIIMWSIGNEVRERDKPEGTRIAKALANAVRKLDPTRPVTAGINEHWVDFDWKKSDGLFAALDVCGYNYMPDYYGPDHRRLPNRIIFGSESFPRDIAKYWAEVEKHPHVIGDFVWTGFDYLGESGVGIDLERKVWVGPFPAIHAFCGDLDLCGFKRPQSYLRNMVWRSGKQIACFVVAPNPTFGMPYWTPWSFDDLQANWNWEVSSGEKLQVHVFSSYDNVRLRLNGRDLGEKQAGESNQFLAVYEVPYERGQLVAEGIESGEVVEQAKLESTGSPAQIHLSADRKELHSDGQDLCFVTVEIQDEKGRQHPAADPWIEFRVEGAGGVAGVCSGNPFSSESFRQPRRKAFQGRCLLVVNASREPGEIRIEASSPGLVAAQLSIHSVKP